jgi:hypothetical protein
MDVQISAGSEAGGRFLRLFLLEGLVGLLAVGRNFGGAAEALQSIQTAQGKQENDIALLYRKQSR